MLNARAVRPGVILVLILLVFISPLIKGAVGGVLGFIVALALASVSDRIWDRGSGRQGFLQQGSQSLEPGSGHAFPASIGFGILGIGVGL